MKTTKEQIKKMKDMYEKGASLRAIQKKFRMSSHSLVRHHILGSQKFKSFILPEKFPVKSGASIQDQCLCAGWNEYRKEIIKIINSL